VERMIVVARSEPASAVMVSTVHAVTKALRRQRWWPRLWAEARSRPVSRIQNGSDGRAGVAEAKVGEGLALRFSTAMRTCRPERGAESATTMRGGDDEDGARSRRVTAGRQKREGRWGSACRNPLVRPHDGGGRTLWAIARRGPAPAG